MENVLRICLSWKTEIHRLWPPKTGEKPMDRAGMGDHQITRHGGGTLNQIWTPYFFWTQMPQRLIVVKSIWVADIRGKYAKNVPLLYLRISSTLAPSERRNAKKIVEKQAKYRKFQLSEWFSRYRVHKILRYKSCILSTKYPPPRFRYSHHPGVPYALGLFDFPVFFDFAIVLQRKSAIGAR